MQPEHEPGNIIFSLADELLLCIISQIDSHKALCNLAATCSRLQGLTEPFIWQSLLVVAGNRATKIAMALEGNSTHIESVQELSIRYDADNEAGIGYLDPLISQMRKLKHLTIESPCPNNHGGWSGGVGAFPYWSRIDYTRLFEQAVDSKMLEKPLSMLQSVTLHGHRSSDEPFLFGKTAIIFLHPTLRNLTISCTNFDADIQLAHIPHEKLKSTALQSLTFIECNVYISLLEVVLSLPKALKDLSVGERLYVWPGCIPQHDKPRTAHPSFLDVLQKQADSLERLTHCAGNVRYHPDIPEAYQGASKLRNLVSLKHLNVGMVSNLVPHLQDGELPDSLEKVTVFDSSWTLLSNHSALGWGIDTVIKLCYRRFIMRQSRPIDLDIRFTHARRLLPDFKTWCCGRDIEQHSKRLEIYHIAAVLKSRGSRLRIFAQTFDGEASFIPPYMYGEELPKDKLLYDSETLWTFVGTDFQTVDMEHLPRQLAAICIPCRRNKDGCWNNGYGTTCGKCSEAGTECVYPAPPSSLWVNDVEWEEDVATGS